MRKQKERKKFCGERVGMVTLGCARNTVDSESILSEVLAQGAKITALHKATTILVNTCAFTKEAKEESIEAIIDLIELKKTGKIKKIVVHGCLVERYLKELKDNFKEVDGFVGLAPLKRRFNAAARLTPAHYAYIKIAEGCANHCSYCSIPLIKGPLRSRSESDIINEAKRLEESGVREINIVGQDITLFGTDLCRKKPKVTLASLLKKILKSSRIPWIRLLYLHPKRISDELLELFSTQSRICPYVDLPLQHINERLLKLMNRGTSKQEVLGLVSKLRCRIPGVALRTSLIVGFPSETNKEFRELLDFIKATQFDRLGAFKYSREEGTSAYGFKGQHSDRVKDERYNILLSLQKDISGKLLAKTLGRTVSVMVDENEAFGSGVYVGRTKRDAPEVDGVVYLKSAKYLRPGHIVRCRITNTHEYDLDAEVET
jgi:ribosomal protein S12 methylthiotransferase